MSRAFVKEDVEVPERPGLTRSASGLPPRAANYITAAGAKRLRDQLHDLRGSDPRDEASIAELEALLASVTVVEPQVDATSIAFGAKVTVRTAAGESQSYRIVGVDEVGLYPDGISWVSPLGRTLLAAEPGGRVLLEGGERAEITDVEY